MPLTRVTLRLLGDVQYDRAFELLEHEARDMREPFGQYGEYLIAQIDEAFATEGVSSGGKWAELKDPYRTWKAAHYPGKPILQSSGDMKRDLTSRKALTVLRDRLIYEPDSDIAGYHQDGTADMRARPPVRLTQGDKRMLDRIFMQWLQDIRRPPIR